MSGRRNEERNGTRTGKGDDEVERDEHETLHVVRLAVLDEEVDEQDRDEEDNGLEVGEEQRQVVVRDPADYDEQGYDECSNLLAIPESAEEHDTGTPGTYDRAADADTNGEFHLIFHRHPDGGNVLCGVSLHKGHISVHIYKYARIGANIPQSV